MVIAMVETPLILALHVEHWIQSQPGLHSEFQASQGYTESPCLKKQIKQTKKNSWLSSEMIWLS